MKKLLFTIPILLGVLISLTAADNFAELNDAQKLDLSEAYQAVGEHFGKTGEEERGDAYEKTAEILRGQIADLSAAAIARQENTVQSAYAEETPKVKMVSENEQKAVGYYFRKLVRALLSENKDKVLDLLDAPLALEGYLAGVPQEKLENDLDYIFSAYDLTVYDSSDLYYMEDVTFSYEGDSEDVIVVEVKAVTDGEGSPLDQVIFWESVQKFYFKKAAKGWKVFAIL